MATTIKGKASPVKGRSRSNSKAIPPIFTDIAEDEYTPFETESRFAKADFGKIGDSPDKSRIGWVNGKGRTTSGYAAQSASSPFGEDIPERRPFEDYLGDGGSLAPKPKPKLPLRAGLGPSGDGYARAFALYPFQPTDSGDLGLTKGAIVVIMDKVGEGEWWKGRGVDGKVGIFPSNYVEVVEIPKDLKGGVWRSELKARMGDLGLDS
jgi:hypothetical protein